MRSRDLIGQKVGGDYDGDTGSFIAFYVDESLAEFKKKMQSRDFYVAVDGSMAFSSSNDILDLVLGNMA